MTMPSEVELAKLLELARNGDRAALGQLLEQLRPELREMARRELSESLRSRVDESDIIQQSCLSAIRNFGGFQGQTLAEFLAWLKQIHERNIADTIRNHTRYEKRAVSREESGDDALRDSLAPMASPAQQVIQLETASEVAAAVAGLPEAQRAAVQLRHLQGCSLAEIARRLGRSEDAVAGLIRRGLWQLRAALKDHGPRTTEKPTDHQDGELAGSG